MGGMVEGDNFFFVIIYIGNICMYFVYQLWCNCEVDFGFFMQGNLEVDSL